MLEVIEEQRKQVVFNIYKCKTLKSDGDTKVRWSRQCPMVGAKNRWFSVLLDTYVRSSYKKLDDAEKC